MTRATANLLLLLTGAIWGMGFVAQSTAMDAIGPVFFTGVRFLAAAIAVAPLAIFEARRHRRNEGAALRANDWLGFCALGTFLFLALVTQQIGLVTTTVTNSGFLTGVYVVLVPVFGVILFRHWPNPIVWPAVIMVLSGIFLLGGGRLDGLTRGDFWTLACAVFWACHVLLLGRIAPRTGRPFTLAFTQFCLCGALGIVIGLATEPVSAAMIGNALPEILFAGVISGGVAFTLQAVAQRYTSAAQAAIFMSSESLFAAGFGAALLGERLTGIGWIGCALIFTAMLLVELMPRRAAAKPAPGTHEI